MAQTKLNFRQVVLALFVVIACLHLALSAHKQAALMSVSDDQIGQTGIHQHASLAHLWSPFTNQRLDSLKGFDQQQEELSRRLEFMVWPREKADLQQQIDTLYQRRINALPFRASLWGAMLNTDTAKRANNQEQFWLLEKSSTLLKWNLANNYVLARPCAQNHDAFLAFSTTLCTELFSKLPYARRFIHTSQQLGVSPEQMNKLLLSSNLINEAIR